MEKNVLPRPEVVREMENYIPVELFVDRPTEEDRKHQELMIRLTQSNALPIYAIVSPEGELLARIDGRHSSQEMAAFLRDSQEAVRMALR